MKNNGWIKYALAAFLLFSSMALHAQFYLAGDDPGRLRWRTIETNHYKLIYPRGLDSLARVYGRNLEYYRNPVGQTIKYLPGEYTKGKIPVIFHPCNSYSNASVAWAPKRMDVYTQPEAYDPDPMPWETMLAIHEQRHVAQMQFGLSYKMRPFNWFLGEMFNGAMAGAYGYRGDLEGDAVSTETALSASGRGREADFLNYYMISFDQGDWRNLPKWARDSYRKYTPDEYALGYMLLSGIRYFWDYPDYIGDSYTNSAKYPIRILFDKSWTIKKENGLKLWQTFDDVAAKTYSMWKDEAEARRPYMPVDTLVNVPKFYTKYDGLAATEDGIIGYRTSLNKVREVFSLDYDSDKTRKVRQFSSYASNIKASEDGSHIYWSETVSGERWDLGNNSVIRRARQNGRCAKTLTHKGKFYNPAPSPDESRISVSEYPDFGGTFLTILDEDGDVLERHRMPDGFQVVESAWIGDEIYITGITDEGIGVYKMDGDNVSCIMEPKPVTVKDFHSCDGILSFTSDRSGVDEFYELSPDGSRLVQVTSTRYGASNFQYSADRNWLYFTANEHDGKLLGRTATTDLLRKEVDFDDIHKYAIADKLSEQEKSYSYEEVSKESVEFTEEKKYRKVPHLFNVHSWVPLHINGNTIMNRDFSDMLEIVDLGASAIMQNNLGTLTGVLGYAISPSTDGQLKDNGRKKWRNSLHATLKYTGLYPVFEATVDFNDRAAYLYNPIEFTNIPDKGAYVTGFSHTRSNAPYFHGTLKAYIPWYWAKGGWYTGLVPEVSYSISNDTYTSGYQVYRVLDPDYRDLTTAYVGYKEGGRTPFQSLTASVRGYCVQGTADSGVYPRFGIGAEVGTSYYLGINVKMKLKSGAIQKTNIYAPSAYAFLYGYLPGVVPQQGMKITAKYHHGFIDDGLYRSGAINPLPRGLSKNTALLRQASISAENAIGLTFDYAIPFWIGDPCVAHGLIYATNMVLTPHFDYFTNGAGYLYSVGGSLEIAINRIFWIGVPFKVGITYSYNGGSLFGEYTNNGVPMDRHFIGPVFSLNL